MGDAMGAMEKSIDLKGQSWATMENAWADHGENAMGEPILHPEIKDMHGHGRFVSQNPDYAFGTRSLEDVLKDLVLLGDVQDGREGSRSGPPKRSAQALGKSSSMRSWGWVWMRMRTSASQGSGLTPWALQVAVRE